MHRFENKQHKICLAKKKIKAETMGLKAFHTTEKKYNEVKNYNN